MGGAFRDEELAARQRADALDERVRELEEEKHALEVRLAGGPLSDTSRRGPSLVAITLGLGAFGLVASLLFVRALPLALLAAAVVVFMALVWGVGFRQYVQARPGELWVVTGGRAVVEADGSVSSFRLLFPGQRRVLLPFIEVATSLSLQPKRLDVVVEPIYALGGRTLRAHAVVSVMIDGQDPRPAVERFLGRPEQDIAQSASDVVRSALREVLGETSPDDLEPVRTALRAALQEDLGRLGLTLDALLELELSPAAA